jgi:hypothetical protein
LQACLTTDDLKLQQHGTDVGKAVHVDAAPQLGIELLETDDRLILSDEHGVVQLDAAAK